jgi:hypothetical protein
MVGTVGLEPTCIKRLILSEMGIPIPPRALISPKLCNKPNASTSRKIRRCCWLGSVVLLADYQSAFLSLKA